MSTPSKPTPLQQNCEYVYIPEDGDIISYTLDQLELELATPIQSIPSLQDFGNVDKMMQSIREQKMYAALSQSHIVIKKLLEDKQKSDHKVGYFLVKSPFSPPLLRRLYYGLFCFFFFVIISHYNSLTYVSIYLATVLLIYPLSPLYYSLKPW